MNRKLLLFLLLVTTFLSCKKTVLELPISQNIHKNWEFKSANDSVWKNASVPGNIFTDLLTHKLIPNPFVLNNEEKVQWVSDSTWVYKTTFNLSEKILKKKHIELQFFGLDNYAKIYINGNYQLDTDNAFKKYSISLKDIPISQTNELKIVFHPRASYENSAKTNSNYQLPEGNRIYTRKAQFQYGWDWGPKLNTVGIWKSVTLKAWDEVVFNNIYIKQQKITKENASLNIEFEIKSDTDKNVTIITSANKQTHSKPLHILKGTHTYTIPFEIKNPILWWTHNLGKPHLYQFDFQLIENNKIKDQQSIKKGIRTIKLITEKDSIGESFYFELNGKPVYMKGANYIPQNSFQNKVTNQHYKKLISDVVDANMNMLRIWGGGIYENDIFYELCDEKGILVWQDFMFACAMYPGDTEFLANVAQEAEDQVKRLRNYTSIALWCGNNENSEGWHRWGWQANRTEKEKEEIWNDYLAVFDTILPTIVKKFSNEISYWESSPKYGRGNPKYKFEGDAHDWWVWHDAKPFEHFEQEVPRFMSEFGFQSFPSYQTINYINQKDSVDLQTEAIKSHQKHSRGFQLIEDYMKRDYKLPKNDEDYVYMSQLVQAKGIVMGIEAHRRAKPYNMGTLYWQLNDCWPAISWSSIDYFGNWKALHYKAKKAYNNILISTIKTKYDYDTYIVNDLLEDVQGTLKLKMIDFYGKEIWSNSKETTVKANSSQKVYHIPQVNIYKTGFVYIVEFNNSQSLYYFAKPKELNLPKASIQKTIRKTKNGFTITLKSAVLQKDVFLSTKQKGHFSDNFFDILPNQELTVEFTTNATSLDDLTIKSLNSIY